MKTKKYLILLAGVLAAIGLTSCSEMDEQAKNDAKPVPVNLTTGIQASLRRAGTTLNQGMLETGDVAVFTDTNWATKYTYTAQTGGSLTSASPAYYPANGDDMKIVAVYPAASFSTAASATAFTVAADQSSDANYKASDLMRATITKNKTSGADAQAITLYHKMAKIIVNVTTKGGLAAPSAVTLKNIKRKISYDPKADSFSGSAAVADNSGTDVAVGTNNVAAVIPPQDLSGEFLDITIGSQHAKYSLTGTKPVEAGNYYLLNIEVTPTSVGVTNQIDDWDGSGTVYIGTSEWKVTVEGTYTYDGTAKVPAAGNITVKDVNNVTVDASNYTTVCMNNINAGEATLYVYGTSDGNYGKFAVTTYTIGKADVANGSWSIDPASLTIQTGTKSQTITVTRPGDGAVQAESSDPSVATVSVTGTTVTVTSTAKEGTANITITVADGTNWTYAGNHVCAVTTSDVPAYCIGGQFTINGSGDKVYFSQGNLRATYNGSSWSWAFATNQWDYVGNAASNTSVNGNGTVSSNGTVDLFGWVGASSTTLTGDPAKYGISNSTTNSHYGNSTSDALKSDWGTKMGSGWKTLSTDEWNYVLSTRTAGGTVFGTASARYAHATINTDGTSRNGLILFPDGVNIAASEVTTAGTVNGTSAWATKCTTAQWAALAAKGCVFLPAAGYRNGSSVNNTESRGFYWSSSPNPSDANCARYVGFYSGNLNPQSYFDRYYGRSVRLVRPVE